MNHQNPHKELKDAFTGGRYGQQSPSGSEKDSQDNFSKTSSLSDSMQSIRYRQQPKFMLKLERATHQVNLVHSQKMCKETHDETSYLCQPITKSLHHYDAVFIILFPKFIA